MLHAYYQLIYCNSPLLSTISVRTAYMAPLLLVIYKNVKPYLLTWTEILLTVCMQHFKRKNTIFITKIDRNKYITGLQLHAKEACKTLFPIFFLGPQKEDRYSFTGTEKKHKGGQSIAETVDKHLQWTNLKCRSISWSSISKVLLALDTK